jgi:hypothetical protein
VRLVLQAPEAQQVQQALKDLLAQPQIQEPQALLVQQDKQAPKVQLV